MSELKDVGEGAGTCIDLLGLSVTHRADGCWMRFKASNGKEALIDLNNYAKDRGSVTRSAIEQWIEDVRPKAVDADDAAQRGGDSLTPQEKTNGQ